MPSETGIMDALDLLASAGLVPRNQSRRSVASAWLATMPEVSDDMLLGACVLHLRGADCAWFPKPGQLLGYMRGTEDTSHADWARLRALRSKHGATFPTDPSEPRTFPLADSRPEAQARWKGLEACGGWDAFRNAVDWNDVIGLFRVGYDSAVDSGRRQLAGENNWSKSVKLEVAHWLTVQSSSLAAEALIAMASNPNFRIPANPMKPQGFRLHPNPIRERAMFAGLLASGGWREIWPDSMVIPEHMKISNASNRKAFCAAYSAAMQRGRKREDASAVLRLADSASVKGMLGLMDWGKP